MSDEPPSPSRPARAPAHLWVVGLLLVLWNAWGVALAIGAQTDRLPAFDAQASAYFDRQPLWFVLLADIGPLAGVAGAVALLLQSRWASRLFVGQIVFLALGNAYEMLVGTSLLLSSPQTRAASLVLTVLIAGQIVYARSLSRRGVLY